MSKLIVGFSTPKKFGIFAWLIKVVEGTNYSHVYVRWDAPSVQRTIVYQASGTKVNFITYPNFLLVEDIIEEYEIEVTEEQQLLVRQFAYDNSSKPYSVLDIFGLAYVLFMRRLGFNPKNPINDGRSQYVCSELISYILTDCLTLSMPIDNNSMTPKDVNDFIKTVGKKVSP